MLSSPLVCGMTSGRGSMMWFYDGLFFMILSWYYICLHFQTSMSWACYWFLNRPSWSDSVTSNHVQLLRKILWKKKNKSYNISSQLVRSYAERINHWWNQLISWLQKKSAYIMLVLVFLHYNLWLQWYSSSASFQGFCLNFN